MAILNYVVGTLLMHHGRLAFHVQDGADGPHHTKPIETEPVDPLGVALTITIVSIYLILSNLVNDSCRELRHRAYADYVIIAGLYNPRRSGSSCHG
jgi:hypothetical protein